MNAAERRRHTQKFVTLVGGLIVVAIIVWIDVATGVWQELTILSGLAAGLVTFLLSALVLGRVVERSAARRWAPINRLALTEFLHAIVDDNASDIALGEFVPRTLDLPAALLAEQPAAAAAPASAKLSALTLLRDQVVAERRTLSDALSRWTSFLASSGDNEQVLRHVAGIALQLDLVRDAALEVERAGDPSSYRKLQNAVSSCNSHSIALINELRARLVLTDEHQLDNIS